MQKMILKSMAAAALAISPIAAAMVVPFGAAASAEVSQHAQILARDAHGRATEVRVDGHDYMVCNAQRQDECINPRAAGLHFGNRPLAYWPGKPASEMKG